MEEHASRQDLVVPPKGVSVGSLVIGAMLCGLAGFSVVWVAGIGRTVPMTEAPLPTVTTSAPPATIGPAQASATIAGDTTEPSQVNRFSTDAAVRPAGGLEQPTSSRFSTQPASFEEPASPTASSRQETTPVEGEQPADPAQPLSRFSANKQIAPPELPPATPAAATLIAPSAVADESLPVDEAAVAPSVAPTTPSPAEQPDTPTEPAEEAAPVPEKDETDSSTKDDSTTPDVEVAAAAATEIATPPPEKPAAAKPTTTPPAAVPDAAVAVKPSEAAASTPPANTPTKVAPTPAAPQPLAENTAAAPLSAAPNPFAQPRDDKRPKASSQALQNTGVALPFAAAPPVTATPATASAATLPTTPARLDAEPAGSQGVQGMGRPGVPNLEGVQTPQLTIEKSGPRDLQVGKPARFEVTIRNVGAATACETVLHDQVPFGTSLITTMPPASPAGPGEPSGALEWAIGELKPGQEARVAMEVMPEQEGEVGSVASVSFRADATVRSRVTKPALAIIAEPPAPTLIGQPMTVDLTLTNPGTGTATGVVVEGLLPEAVSHPAGREVEFDVGQLEPGASKSISLVLTTVTPGVHQISLGARADGDIDVTQELRAEITAPMLELAADIPSRRYLQRPATCTIQMSNTGTAPALAVELAAQLPAGVKFVRANNAGYYDERTHRVLWSLEELPAGEIGTVEFVVMPTTLGPQPLVVATRNPTGLADQLSHTIEVEGLAALSIEVTDSEDPIELGGVTEYVVRVVNEGTKAATNVELVAKLLGNLEPVNAQGPVPHGVENLQVVFDPLASLAAADEAVFRVQVRGRQPGNQRMQFLVKSDDLQAPLTAEEMTHVYSDR